MQLKKYFVQDLSMESNVRQRRVFLLAEIGGGTPVTGGAIHSHRRTCTCSSTLPKAHFGGVATSEISAILGSHRQSNVERLMRTGVHMCYAGARGGAGVQMAISKCRIVPRSHVLDNFTWVLTYPPSYYGSGEVHVTRGRMGCRSCNSAVTFQKYKCNGNLRKNCSRTLGIVAHESRFATIMRVAGILSPVSEYSRVPGTFACNLK